MCHETKALAAMILTGAYNYQGHIVNEAGATTEHEKWYDLLHAYTYARICTSKPSYMHTDTDKPMPHHCS